MRACPFCGYDEGWTKEQSYAKPPKFRVECNICGAVGPEAKSHEMAEKKWDGLLAKILNQDKFEEALEEDMGGVSTPGATLVNTPGMGNAQPAASAGLNTDGPSGSGDKWGDSSIGMQTNESNINPYDKIGQMMAKKMGVKSPFKKKDSRTNTVEQETFEELSIDQPDNTQSFDEYVAQPDKVMNNAKKEKVNENRELFRIETLDDYVKASQHVPDHPLTTIKKKVNEGEDLRDQNALKDVKGKDALTKLGVSFEMKPGKSGKDRVFITEPMEDVLLKIEQSDWEEYGKNPENTIRKWSNGDKVLTIYAEGKDLPRVTVTSKVEVVESYKIRKVVPNSLDPYLKG